MTIAERIDAILKERGLSRRRLAIRAGIAPSTFQSAMQRNGSMNYEMIQKVAQALNCDLSELLTPREESDMIVQHVIAGIQKAKDIRILDESEMQKIGVLSFESDGQRISFFYSLLNDEGMRVAADRVQELTEIAKYRRRPIPQAQWEKDAPDES